MKERAWGEEKSGDKWGRGKGEGGRGKGEGGRGKGKGGRGKGKRKGGGVGKESLASPLPLLLIFALTRSFVSFACFSENVCYAG